jgi:diadenosine tetraphosphatase ApaH/serine/threonine PP2A family protein phosphatase
VSGSSDGDATVTTPIDAGALLQELMTSDQLPALEVMIELCKAGRTVFAKEEPLLTVTAPCVVVGDIHGQLRDLQHNILRIAGDLGKVPLLFLGDFVDRGASSLHCMAILICAKILHPDKVFLIRGNHESRMTNSVYGFLTECHSKYPVEMTENTPPATINIFFAQPTHPLWAEMNRVFDALPLAAIIGDRIFCVHGGLSPRARSIDTIIAMNRFCDIDQGVMSDLTWSDPFCATGFQYNHRGCGQLFGEDVSAEFLEKNNLLFVCRAHQCVRDGYCWAHNNQVLTLFSAPNYCGQGNLGAVMLVDDNLQHSFATYSSYVPPPPAEEGLPLAASPPSNVSVSSSVLTDSSSPAAEAPAETPAAAPDKTLPPYF